MRSIDDSPNTQSSIAHLDIMTTVHITNKPPQYQNSALCCVERGKIYPPQHNMSKVRPEELLLKEVSIIATPAQPEEETLNTAEPKTSTRHKSIVKSKREVSFDNVNVREYGMELGDNPACSVGAPVMLGWEYTEKPPVDLDVYECERRPRYKLKLLVLSFYRRQDILRCAGYSDAELKAAANAVAVIQRKRATTRLFLPFSKVEDCLGSAARKTKRIFAGCKSVEQ